jgi:hypothetical protein
MQSLQQRQFAQKGEDESRDAAWKGFPELWLFKRLTKPSRERATRIRDWCEEKLEFMHSRGEIRYWTAHGVGHSKRVLRIATDFLRAFEASFMEPMELFALYVCAFCHDLGLMFREGEDPDDPATFAAIRKSYGRRVWENILGGRQRGLPPAWKEMGFASEREAMVVANLCAVHQKKCKPDLLRLPKSDFLLSDGGTKTIRPFTLAALLRLADALDCHERRLPPTSYLQHRAIPHPSFPEYARHEVVEDIGVGPDATLHVGMRVRYVYPADFQTAECVRQEIQAEVSAISKMMAPAGLRLPPPLFNTVEALFLETHPYWRSANPESHGNALQ